MVLRYGQQIGRARMAIEPGQHIHTHNLGFEEMQFAYEFPEGERKWSPAATACPTFLGYQR